MDAKDFPYLTAEQYRKLRSIEGNGMGSGVLPAMMNGILARLAAVEGVADTAIQPGEETDPTILSFESDPSAGGGATETLTVTGLLATDEIISVTMKTQGANPAQIAEYANQDDDELDVTFSADPGAGAVVEVTVKRA